MRFIISFFFLLYGCIAFCAAPELKGIPSKSSVFKPEYVRHLNTERINYRFESKKYGQSGDVSGPWDVYSDRDSNFTYNKPSDTGKRYSCLSFKERVRIAQIRSGYALVYSPKERNDVFPLLPSNIDWKGWVPLSNLILQDRVIANSKGRPKLLLISATCDDSNNYCYPPVYNLPATGKDMKPVLSNDFYYLIKRNESGYYLLATGIDITKAENILGWVNSSYLLEWNDRIALTPTWELEDNRAFRDKNEQAEIVSWESVIGRIPLISEQEESYKYSPHQFRRRIGLWHLPKLYEYQLKDTSVVAIVADSQILENSDANHSAQNHGHKYNSKGNVVNIKIVIDGSRMYEPFFPILAETIDKLHTNSIFRGVDLRIGVTIYHDARNSQYVTETHPMASPGNASLYEFIDMGGSYGFLDNLSESSLISAINEALTTDAFNSGENNYLLVMGGRGDQSDMPLGIEYMADILKDNNIKVCALQFQCNSGVSAYLQYGYFWEEVLCRKNSDLNSISNNSITVYKKNENFTNFITQFKESKTDRLLFDNLTVCVDGLMTEDAFENYLSKIFLSIATDAASNPTIDNSGCNFFLFGEVPNHINGRSPCKEVVLCSEEDFNRLISFYSKISDISLNSQCKRDSLALVIEEYLPDVFEKTITYDDTNVTSVINKKSIYQLISLITGTPFNETEYAGPILADIISKNVFPEDQYRHMLQEMNFKYRRLLDIRSNDHIYSAIFNGQKYYWVPVEDLK